MADATSSAAEIVNEQYDRSIQMANEASSVANSAAHALNNAIYQPATISTKWETLPAPNLPPIPNVPTMPALDLVVPDGMPVALSETIDDVEIADFTDLAPTLNFGVAPVLNIGAAPAIPAIRDVAIPDAPDITLPDAPAFLDLQTHTFAGVDMHEEWLDKLDDVPTLTLLAPAPFAYAPGARYASALLDNLKATLNFRIQGGSGFSPEVEEQIWGRELDRETTIGLAREQEVLRSNEALGFPLPQGVMTGQFADAVRDRHNQLTARARDIAIKRAEQEQTNAQNAVQNALQLETVLMDDAFKMEQLAFQFSKETADNAIAVHNAALDQFKALLDGYRSYASVYQTLIQAEMNKVEVFKALLQAEQAKADINKSLVDRFRAEIDARMSAVEIYKARVSAAQTLVELERTRIQAGGEQIRAFVATVNAETAKAELYKVQLDGEKTKMEVFGEQVKAYGVKVGAQGEKARAQVAKYQALISAKQLEWEGWRSRLSAASAQVEAAARKSGVIADAYRIGAHAAEAQAQSFMRRWEADIQQYQAGTNITFQAAKINADAVQHANDARADVAKVQLTTASQRLASAWSMVSTSAAISGSATMNQTLTT